MKVVSFSRLVALGLFFGGVACNHAAPAPVLRVMSVTTNPTAPLYPPAARYQLGDEALSTFQGDVDVAVPFMVAVTAPEGVHQLSGKVHYQACTAGRCWFPRDEPFVATLHVVPKP